MLAGFQEAMKPVTLNENSKWLHPAARRCCVNRLDEGWNELTSLDQLNAENLSGIAAYAAAKTLSERAVWDLAEKHKDVDFTTSQSPFRPPR